MREISIDKTIVVAFSGGESSAYALMLILNKYKDTHKVIVCFCNTGEEDEETFIFTKRIAEHLNIEVIWLEYRSKRGFEIIDFDKAYRITDFEINNEYPNHPFHTWVKDYGLPQYPERTCTRDMKERTISRYLSSIGVMPRMCVRVVGIRFDEIGKRKPSAEQYYPLILNGVTKPFLNRFFQFEMPFRLNLESYLGNCGACISKGLRNLCTVYRERPEKFDFFKFLNDKYGGGNHTFYMKYNTIDSIIEMANNKEIKNAKDNRFNFNYQQDLFFDPVLDTEGGCGGTCEAFA